MPILLGNNAIALGLIDQGCRMVTAYPGTPSSEILAAVVQYKKQHGLDLYAEWSTNEKVAFEIALAGSWAGWRTAVAMKQVGLNVAADPLFSAAYTGVKGGFLVISADDPGLHSSQTEQDSRLIALAAKVPVFDPATPEEARQMVGDALSLSERYGLPVMLRPTTRLCHAVQSTLAGSEMAKPPEPGDSSPAQAPPTNGSQPTLDLTQWTAQPAPHFRKNPLHWVAMPRQRYRLRQELAEKLQAIEAEFAQSPLNYVVNGDAPAAVGVITSGVVYHTVRQTLLELGLSLPILKIGTPYPLPQTLVNAFIADRETVIVLEETDACIELQVGDRRKLRGRLDGSAPAAGELTPEVVAAVLSPILSQAGYSLPPDRDDAALATAVNSLPLPLRRPRLCPGCAHRSAFFALKQEFGPKAIYPGDIGCYTLGANLRAVDTLLDMGASITMAEGLYQANRLAGDDRPIIATIGDSTFLHAGVPALINAVHTGARFVLIILDNHTTAMTGFQPTAASTLLADGSTAARRASLPDLARACGATFVREIDPYDQDGLRATLRAAHEHTQAPDGRVAVVIADRPCVLYDPRPVRVAPRPVVITADCDGCRYCLEAFECPALYLQPDGSRVDVNYQTCIDCGQCVDACYKGFIQWKL